MKRRAPELLLTDSSSSRDQQQLTRADYIEFEAVIAPVEAASGGVRLASRGRWACIAAWRDYRPGFLQCVHDVLRSSCSDKVALLCSKVFLDDHKLGPAAPAANREGGMTDERYSRYDI